MMNAILDERLRQAKTQKRLAHEAGIDARTLRKIEKGEDVSLETRRMVCKALGIDPDVSTSVPPESERAEHVGKARFVTVACCELVAVLSVVGLLCSAFGVLLHNGTVNWPNAKLAVTSAAPCAADADATVRGSVKSALPSAVTRDIEVHRATDSCEVIVNMIIDMQPDDIIARLSASGIKARLDGYRPPAVPWGFSNLFGLR